MSIINIFYNLLILRLLKYLTLIFIASILLYSCSTRKGDETVEIKIIQYDVTYINENAGSIPTRILPNKMQLVFGDDYAMNSIEGFLGQFSLTYIANLKKKKVTTLLKLFDKKYYYLGPNGEFPCGIDPMKAMVLKPTGKSANILGFKAKEYDLGQIGINGLKIYTTNDIDVKSPNNNTPYSSIDEVLLQFYTKLSVLEMYLVAESFEEDSASINIFSIPDDYEPVTRIKMENTLAELFK
ncbi:MAG: hypothetical protein KAS71_08350 [Bacteroidales bacterium]|nr:hypothetical protein [Bacteroidales bacterium]